MAIMGFIIVVAGRAFSDATGMRVRSQNMLNSAEEAGRISAILKEDISQMGAKSWGVSSASGSGSGSAFQAASNVHMNYNANPNAPDADFSSYTLERNSPPTPASLYDALTYRKVYYDAKGLCSDVLEVEWSVRDSTLYRKCRRFGDASCTGDQGNFESECPTTNDTEVEMAKNVSEFRLLPSIPGAYGSSSASSADTLFPVLSASSFSLVKSASSGQISGSTVSLSGFVFNSSSGSNIHSNFYLAEHSQSDCKELTFLPKEEYVISFELPCYQDACTSGGQEKFNPMILFQAGRDHLSVGLRNSANGQPFVDQPDFLFYPPQRKDAPKVRHFEFSVPVERQACIGITAAFYGPAAEGHLDISNFKVYRKTDNVYHFNHSSGSNYNPSGSSKAGVKAFELTLGINKRSEINRVTTVIPVPNNGVMSEGGY